MPVGEPAYGAYQISMFFCFTDSPLKGRNPICSNWLRCNTTSDIVITMLKLPAARSLEANKCGRYELSQSLFLGNMLVDKAFSIVATDPVFESLHNRVAFQCVRRLSVHGCRFYVFSRDQKITVCPYCHLRCRRHKLYCVNLARDYTYLIVHERGLN
jgi:hypothetical protein